VGHPSGSQTAPRRLRIRQQPTRSVSQHVVVLLGGEAWRTSLDGYSLGKLTPLDMIGAVRPSRRYSIMLSKTLSKFAPFQLADQQMDMCEIVIPPCRSKTSRDKGGATSVS
jgi:hypothetical protein